MDSKRLKQIALDDLLSGGAAAPTYTISGTVYDADGSTAVEGATVALGALSAVSAANGTYIISGVPSGTSGSMTCTKTGYSWTAISVSAMTGNLTGQDYVNIWWAAAGISAGAVGIYRAIGVADLATSYVNLKNPGTNDAAPGVAPTFAAATGWTFNGSSQYLTTGIVPATGWSMFVRFSNRNGIVVPCGSFAGSNAEFYFYLNDTHVYYANGGNTNKATPITAGVLGIAGNKGYRNGVDDNVTIPAWGVGTAEDIYIGARNESNSPTTYLNGKIQALAIYNAILTAPQAAALSAAMAALANP